MNKVRKCIYFGLSLLMICSVTACSSDTSAKLSKSKDVNALKTENMNSEIYYDEYNLLKTGEIENKEIIGYMGNRIYFSGVSQTENEEIETAKVNCSDCVISNGSQLEAYGNKCTCRSDDKLFSVKEDKDKVLLCVENADGSGGKKEIELNGKVEKLLLDSRSDIYLFTKQSLRIFTSDLVLVQTIDFTKILQETGYTDTYVYDMCVSEDDTIYLSLYNKVSEIYNVCILEDNKTLKKITEDINDLDSTPTGSFINKEGNLLISSGCENSSIDVIDVKSGQIKLRYDISGAQQVFGCTGDYDVIYRSSDGIYGYYYESDTSKLIMSNDVYNYQGYELSNVTLYNNEAFISVSNKDCNDYSIFESSEEGDIYYEYPAFSLINSTIINDNLYYISCNDQGEYALYNIDTEAENSELFILPDVNAECVIEDISADDKMNVLVIYVNENDELVYEMYSIHGERIGSDKLSYDTQARFVVHNEDGEIFIIGNNKIYKFNSDKCKITEINNTNFPSNETKFYNGNSDYDFYYSCQSGLYGYSTENGEACEIFSWANTDSSIVNKNSVYALNGNAVYCSGKDKDNNDMFCKYVKADKERMEELNSRQKITLAGNGLEKLYSAISDFNKNNDSYRICPVDYSKYGSDSNDISGCDQFNKDLIKGDIPDIIIIDPDMDIASYVTKNMFANMSEFISNDPEYNENDYFQTVSHSFKYDNMLYAVGLFYNTYGMTVNTQTDDTWNFDQFLENVFNSQFSMMFDQKTQQYRELISKILFTSYTQQYVNLKDKKCDFNNEKFIKLLELINSNTTNNFEDFDIEDSNNEFRNRVAFMSEAKISSLFDYYEYYSDMGLRDNEQISLSGVPSPQGGARFLDSDCLISASITNKSDNKEGAWQFIKYLLSDSIQKQVFTNDNNYMPVNKTVYNAFSKKCSEILEDQDELFSESIEDEYNQYMNTPVVNDLLYQSILEIINESANAFFNQEITSSQAATEIQSKISLYLNEIS